MSYDFECGTCSKAFSTGWQARDNHLYSTGHRPPAFECGKCARYFGTEAARFQHMKALNHFAWECSKCSETWPTKGQLVNHEHDDHKYCSKCERIFNDRNSIKMVRPASPSFCFLFCLTRLNEFLQTASPFQCTLQLSDPVPILQYELSISH